MNPIAVSGTAGTVVFPGVAEAAANGSAPASLVDLFGQILANAQAGITATVPQGENTVGDGTAESAEAPTVLAAALAAMPVITTTETVPVEDAAVVQAVTAADAVVANVPADATESSDGALLAQVDELLQAADAPEPAPPEMTLAMQLA